MSWLSTTANVAQILSLVPLALLGLGAIQERRAQQELDRLINDLLAFEKARLPSPPRIGIKRGRLRERGALLGARLGILRLTWNRGEWSARLSTLNDPQP